MGDDEIVKEFLVESYENLDRLDQDLIALEKDPHNAETLASIFRTIHTIKGTSGFLGFNQLEALTHVGENLLARLRDGLLELTLDITTALLAMVDAVRQMLGSIETNASEGKRDDQELIARLTRLVQNSAGKVASRDNTVEPDMQKEVLHEAGTHEIAEAIAPEKTVAKPRILPDEPARRKAPKHKGGDDGIRIYEAESADAEYGPHDREGVAEKTAAGSKDTDKDKDKHDEKPANGLPTARGQGASDSTIRVDVGQLDRLMNRMGELVLLRNQIVQFTNAREDSDLLGTSQRLNLLTTELQEDVMKTRMQPIGNIWAKFPRTVRDVAVNCGKQVRIEMEGEETELDKTIIEAIKDPLTHLVRNAVDHGIESPAVRETAGKDAEGRLGLRAFHEGGQVNIEITDDGAGLNYEKLRAKALEKGLVSTEQAGRLSEREIAHLIFLPGFSTAEKVTNVSGRGVGMDVVKTNIEKIGGTVDVQSKPGQGTTVRMKIPLTLAIIPALIVTSQQDRYAIPQVSLLELVRLEGEQAHKGIELVHGAPVYRLRGRLLPLVYLNRELKTDATPGQVARESRIELPDFALARQRHEQWIGRLKRAIDDAASMRPEHSGSAEECALGKWLYATGLKQHQRIAEMQVLEATHRQFHEVVREVLTLRARGELKAAERESARMEPLSQKIIDLLATVERKVSETQNVNIVVLRADDRQFGLVVDDINDTEEIVVKPLSKQLKSINTYAGATIMGDGRVALILDVLGLAQRANVVGEVRERILSEKEEQPSGAAATGDRSHAVLLIQHGQGGRMAIDLAQVARLEEFSRGTVEIAGDREVVQYRGQIMPLVRVSEVLASRHSPAQVGEKDALQVVVYAEKGRSVGLVVDRILDIVEEGFELEPQTQRPGVLGSAVIQKRVTDLLDVRGLIAAAGLSSLAAANEG